MIEDFFTEFLPMMIGLIVAFCGIVLGVAFAYSLTLGRWECESFAQITRTEHRYSVLAGCFIRAPANNEMIPLDAYKHRYIQDRHQVEMK